MAGHASTLQVCLGGACTGPAAGRTVRWLRFPRLDLRWTPRETAQASSIDVRGPMVINPRFEPAKRVRLYTNPLGLRLRVDSTEVLTVDPDHFVVTYPIPGYFDWVGGSRHTLAGVSPQVDILTVFGFSRTGVTEAVRTWFIRPITKRMSSPELTANFVRGVTVSFLTEPAGLKLNIEGRDNWPTTNFVWGVGMTYSVTAPAEQTDSKGRKYLSKAGQTLAPQRNRSRPKNPRSSPASGSSRSSRRYRRP